MQPPSTAPGPLLSRHRHRASTYFRFCCCRWCRSRRCWGCRWVVSGRNIWGCGLGRAGRLRGGCRGPAGGREKDGTYLRFCRWDPGPGGCCGCEGGGAGGAPKKARNPLAGDIICPTLPWSSLGLTEGRGLPTRPETRANWLGDIRPAWQSREGTQSQPEGRLGGKGKGPARAAASGTARKSHVEPAPTAM